MPDAYPSYPLSQELFQGDKILSLKGSKHMCMCFLRVYQMAVLKHPAGTQVTHSQLNEFYATTPGQRASNMNVSE